ncbi:hypothetical protein MNBD_GAMMA06-1240 [hydrothermal vent metagenome]|uniref:Enoyl-CoA hydratase n=1 Tax=hydrothermal vent metagenome TaxID=652676 RepID=A0A3B0W989_9ZZZZ
MNTNENSNTTHQISTEKQSLEYTQFSTRYDFELSTIWCYMHPAPRPCVNINLIDELIHLQKQLTITYKNQRSDNIWPFRHFVLASQIPNIYSLGGDLALFKNYISNKEEDKLREYAHKCVNLQHRNIDNLDLPITSVSLIQGQALGGGFEMALSCDVIIAERSSQLGFPEIMFNLFPGMGAYNLLTRRIGPSLAERIILSGKTYHATELYDMGIIDLIAEDGQGVQATENYLKSHNQSHNTIRSIKKIRQLVHPITQENLYEIVNIWVDAAMNLSEKDLAKMERLLHLQRNFKNSEILQENNTSFTPRRGEWRKVKDATFPLITHLGERIKRNRRKKESRRKKI